MFCNSRVVVLAILIVLTTVATSDKLALAQHSQSPSAGRKVRFEAKDYEQFAPYWTAEPGWRSELQMRNNRAQGDLTVTPVLRAADGSEFPLAPVVIAPNEIKVIDVSQGVITQAPQMARAYGSVVFRYHTEGMRNLYSAVMVYNNGHPIAFHFDASVDATDYDRGSREGIWWLPNQTAKDYLIVTNKGQRPLETTLYLYDASGRGWSEQITVGPQTTNRYSVRELLGKAGLSGTYGGFKIDVMSSVGSLDTAHLLFDETAGFSALMKTFDRNPQGKVAQRLGFPQVTQWVTRAPMLALTHPDPALGFPTGTVLQPKIFVRNTTAVPVQTGLWFNWRSDRSSGSSEGAILRLNPYETQQVDVAALQKNRTIPVEAHWASVELSISGRPNDVMAVAASYDSTLRYGTQTPFNDQLTYRWEGGEWLVDATHNSIITAGNGGTIPIKTQITIYYDAGKKHYDLEQRLKPREQMWVDVGKLIREGVPDKDGKVLPPDVTMGSYELQDLTDSGVGNVFEGKITVDKTFGHAVYACATCCGYSDSPYMFYDPIAVAVGLENNQDVWDMDFCTDSQVSVLGAINPSSWNTDDHSIAMASDAVITGVASGSTTNLAQGTLTIGNVESLHCPRATVNPNGGTEVGISIKTTYWGPPATKTSTGCVYTTIACSTGTPTCKGATPGILFSSGTCPSYVKAENLVINGTCYFSSGTAATGPGPCD